MTDKENLTKKHLTVKELIAKLKEFDENKIVLTINYNKQLKDNIVITDHNPNYISITSI